ncbi:MAG: hybrid sensor histidine kinase/response regulator, partial [Calditrichaeota bacterium]
ATIRKQAERLAELDKMKSRFLANISHEFRTPLTLILGPLEDWLADREAGGNNPTTWKQMHRAGRRLLRLVNQLLDLSRLEAGKLTLSVSRGDFLQFLRSLTISFASLANQKDIRLQFTTSLPENALKEVYFDSDKMETIFSNLLSNAIQYTPRGGQVIVDCRRYDPETNSTADDPPGVEESIWVEVRVQDNGPGIPTADLPHIFDRFYQADSDRSRNSADGVGIGLALVKELTELHHGQIEVESHPEKGTTFTLRFPLHRAAYTEEELREIPGQKPETRAPIIETASSPPETSPSPADADLPPVLVVEDHGDVRRYLRQHLRAEYRILEAADGEEALRLA